jgi:hypothetical protein
VATESADSCSPEASAAGGPSQPVAVDRAAFEAELAALRAQPSLGTLLAGRELGLFHLVCYLRDGDRAFETYWTKRRGVEALDNSYALMDLTVYGRQESWEDSPPGWPQLRTNARTAAGAPGWRPVPKWPGGRPIAQWPRLQAGHADDLTDGT